MSAEATVVRNFIDTLLALPWRKKSKISKDLAAAVKILDADHYGLEKVKERIVEYLAVQQRVDRLKAPILCLVGRPAWARRRSASRSRRRPAASSCG
jgi:ATP-dependent Lon protease